MTRAGPAGMTRAARRASSGTYQEKPQLQLKLGFFVGDIGYGLSEKSLRASCTEDLDAWNGKN